MKRFMILAACVLTLAIPTITHAIDVEIKGNGNAADSSVQVNSESHTVIQQNNSATVNNTVDSNANTGNNSTNGNSGKTTVITGNATTETNINNQLNTNGATITCCSPTPKPTNTPRTTPTISPTINPTSTPTTPGGIGGGSSNQGTSSSNNSSGTTSTQNGGSAPQVLGLSNTSGESTLNSLFVLSGFVCLIAGLIIAKPQNV